MQDKSNPLFGPFSPAGISGPPPGGLGRDSNHPLRKSRLHPTPEYLTAQRTLALECAARWQPLLNNLSAREAQVYNLTRRGLTVKTISSRLEVDEKTVYTYRTRLMKKLQIESSRLLLLGSVHFSEAKE